ncbi:hypothetical protein ACSBR1_040609 [Camellia fascicularis]
MAGAATVSPFISLTCTNLRSNISPSRPLLFPPQSLVLHHHFFRTRFNGNFRLISTHRSKGSIGEEELEEIDEAFSYNNDNVIGEEEEQSDEDDDTESSLDLLFRFLQSMFKKLSKRVRKASRSVLPAVIPLQLVSFAVDGVLLLASLSILKALLELSLLFCYAKIRLKVASFFNDIYNLEHIGGLKRSKRTELLHGDECGLWKWNETNPMGLVMYQFVIKLATIQ